jgi:hypothetical protein
VSDFVDECRREWKRLRVPAGPAGEMADDLAADLREAEADGAFPEEVLGDGAGDPRAFAAAWARERGLVRPRRSDRLRTRGVLIGGVAFVGLLVIGAVLGSILRSSQQAPVVPRAQTVVRIVSTASGRYAFVSSLAPSKSIVGTEILKARLMPAGIQLQPSVANLHRIDRRPTSITTTVRNSGLGDISRVTLVVEVDHKTFVRTFGQLARNTQRRISIPLPSRLPAHFTIRVHTRPVPGEHNLSNNSAAWKISLRP